MPPKGIVLPLNDRPPIRSAVGEFRLPNKRLSTCENYAKLSHNHLVPIRFTGQGASDHRVPHFERLRLSFDPVLCRFCISAGQVQPEERRTRPRQRGIRGCLRCPGAARRRLISAREGCWGKTTRSKSFSIQLVIPVRTSPDPCFDSCGPARSSPKEKTPEEPAYLPTRNFLRRLLRKHGSTLSVYRHLPPGSNLPRRTAHPSRERPAAWKHPPQESQPRTRWARYRGAEKRFLPAILPQTPFHRQGRAAHRSRPGGNFHRAPLFLPWSLFLIPAHLTLASLFSALSQPHQRGNRIARSGSQTTLHGKPLFDMNVDRGSGAHSSKARETIFHAVLRSSVGDPRIVRGQPDAGFRGRQRRNRNNVMNFQRLVGGNEGVEAVSARRSQIKSQIDLRVRSNRSRHTGSL